MPSGFDSRILYKLKTNIMNWDQVKRNARQRIRFRKWLHYYGFKYPSTVGLNSQQLIKMLQS